MSFILMHYKIMSHQLYVNEENFSSPDRRGIKYTFILSIVDFSNYWLLIQHPFLTNEKPLKN